MNLFVEAVGWTGSILLVVSLLQAGMMRLRILNLVAAVLLVGYNTFVRTWPMAAMNAAVAVIDVYYVVQLSCSTRASALSGSDPPLSGEIERAQERGEGP